MTLKQQTTRALAYSKVGDLFFLNLKLQLLSNACGFVFRVTTQYFIACNGITTPIDYWLQRAERVLQHIAVISTFIHFIAVKHKLLFARLNGNCSEI